MAIGGCHLFSVLDLSGEDPLENGLDGVLIDDGASSNFINGGNTISGNTRNGVHISGSGTNFNVVAADGIGVGTDGTSPISNGQSGVLIDSGAISSQIGVAMSAGLASDANTIGFNTLDGVTVIGDDTINNSILQNSIYSNQRLGINLGGNAGVLPNDDKDPDVGANMLQNFPQLISVTANADEEKGRRTKKRGGVPLLTRHVLRLCCRHAKACPQGSRGRGVSLPQPRQ
jgi:hypothetical protein